MIQVPEIARLHYITQDVQGISHAGLAEDACKGGIRWVQFRVKNKPFNEWLEIAKEVQHVCKKYQARLIINDNVEIARLIKADGVHLGKEDLSPLEARKILGDSFIIGGSTNTLEDIYRMNDSSVDYIGLGPFRFTATREKLNPVLGMDGISKLVSFSKVPVIAIGGIKAGDIKTLIRAGVHGVAVSSAINLAQSRTQSAKEMEEELSDSNTLIRTS